jgi:hypothetical protein
MSDDDKDMEAMLSKWNAENGKEGEPESEDEDDNEPLDADGIADKYARDVTITDMDLDHVMLACPDLDKAIVNFFEMTGATPSICTSLNGCGTRSARIAFVSCNFLEIVGPDPKQGSTSMQTKLKALPAGTLTPFHYALRDKSADTKKTKEWKNLGFLTDQVTMVSRDHGMPWLYNYYFMEGHSDGGLVPYFCDWKDNHAAGKLPIVGELKSVRIRAPSDHAVHTMLDGYSNISVEKGDALLEFTISSKNGTHTFSSNNPVGIQFPAAPSPDDE